MECAIAKALDMPVEVLFHDRFDARGKRIHAIRDERSRDAA